MHLKRVAQLTGREPEQLAMRRKLPYRLRYLWEWYNELSESAGASLGGFEPLRYTEIAAWQELAGVRLEYWEVRILMRIHRAFIMAQSNDRRSQPQHQHQGDRR